MRHFSLALAVASIALTAVPAMAAKEVPAVEVSKPEAFKGANQVIVGGFTVVFLTERKDSAQAGGGLFGGGGGGRSTAVSTLGGVSYEQFQAATDAAWEEFKMKLTGAGYSLADRATLVAGTRFTKYKVVASPADGSLLFGKNDTAKALYFAPRDLADVFVLGSNQVINATGFGALGGMMGAAMNNEVNAREVAKAAGVPVINVVYVVDFADTEKYGGFQRSWSSVKMTSALALAPSLSRIMAISPNGKVGHVSLGKPIAIAGDFGGMRDAMSGGDKAGQMAGRVLGMLGGVGWNSKQKLAFDVDGERYAQGVLEAASEATDKLVTHMATLR